MEICSEEMMKRIYILLLFALPVNYAAAQTYILPSDCQANYIRDIYCDTSGTVHTSLRPYTVKMILAEERYIPYSYYYQKRLIAGKKSFLWEFSPLVTTGLNVDNEVIGNNFSAGAGIKQTIYYKNNFTAYFSAMPVSTSFDSIITKYIDSTKVIPHESNYFSRSGNRFNYLTMRGGISWKTAKWFHLFAGYDKTFFGDGIRSLFWSNNSAPFWQVRATVLTRKISYVMLYSFLHDDDNEVPGIHYQNKYSSAHYLNWNIGKRLQLNFFEAVVWRGNDSLALRGYDVNYINPIIFYRPVEFNLGSPDNVLIGIGGRLRLFKALHLYGQFIFDEFKLSEVKAKTGWWANKYGILAGARSVVNIDDKRFMLIQAEISGARPFTYSHINSLENFGNQMQPIAHPMGANFRDAWLKISYTPSRWTFSLAFNNALYRSDSLEKNMGYNIYRSFFDSRNEYGNTWLQGIPQSRTMVEVKAAWWLNFNWNMTAEGGIRYYNLQYDANNIKQIQVFAGLVTRF